MRFSQRFLDWHPPPNGPPIWRGSDRPGAGGKSGCDPLGLHKEATMQQRYRKLIPIAVTLSIATTGCGMKRDVLDTEIATIRAEMTSGDAALARRMDAGDARMSQLEERIDGLQVMSGRVEDFEQELQSVRRDFDTDIDELQAAIRFNSPVHFDYESDSIRLDDRQLLDRFARIVGTYYPIATVTIEGFTDPAGDAEYNLALGGRRANNVKDYLLTQGLVEQRVRVVSYGESSDRQITPGAWGDLGLANRRVALVIDYSGNPAESIAGVSDSGRQ